jgi:spore maturation protein CgeB
MRQDLTTFLVTGRSFEILAAGSLLVQEACPDMDCFFIAGEHYLPFSTFAELRGIVDFLRRQPEEAERVRRAGNAFYRARYHDDKLIGYLDHALYGTHR